jgi:hypothetical protein
MSTRLRPGRTTSAISGEFKGEELVAQPVLLTEFSNTDNGEVHDDFFQKALASSQDGLWVMPSVSDSGALQQFLF